MRHGRRVLTTVPGQAVPAARRATAGGVALVLAAVVLTACGGVAPSAAVTPTAGPAGIEFAMSGVPRASASPADATAAAASINAFGLDLYRQVGKLGGNLVISPASVAIALAMARAGARGETAAQMDTVLQSLGSDAHAAAVNAIDQALAGLSGSYEDGAGESHQVTLQISNAPFAQRGLALNPTFLDALASRFGAGLRLVDYMRDPEAARLLINGWVKEQTAGRIPELLTPGLVDDSTRLTLVNAIYLKAPWETPFDAALTRPGPFTRADGHRVTVPMMSLQGGGVRYATGTGWRAVEIPYLGGSLAMTVIVPDDLAAFEAGLSPNVLDQVIASLQRQAVDLTFPRFGIDTRADLKEALKAMGMPLAFDGNLADFSGITSDEPLYIGFVIHQANIDVDEKGTEASAATAVGMVAAGPGDTTAPLVFRVDRPFLFALRDTTTGAILFLGRVADPSASS